ncbi:MAG: C4-dicarboxylate ABC transporter [Hyphomicrobiales bacterium]|nr:C4-dicarboxylate ABC transporter [Hyphomicrobiales bacterium]
MRASIAMKVTVGLALVSALVFAQDKFDSVLASRAQAQAIPKSLEEGGPENAVKLRKNNWTVGVAGGILSGTYMTFASEMADVLDDGDNLRVLPVATYGSASNLEDLLYLRGIDVAVTQSDVFEFFQTQRKITNLQHRIHYILRLPISEVHILAKRNIRSLEDLRGKKVNFGPAGSGSSLTGTVVFQRAGVKVEQTFYDNPAAMQKLRSGEIAALIRVIGKPIDVLSKIPASADLHLVPIPFTKAFSDYYALSEFTKAEYPSLIGEGDSVSTIGVPAVLAVYNWPLKSDRARRVQRLVERMFTNWEKFQNPPRHPKWREVNLAATVPGWTRWQPAEDMLRALRAQQVQATPAAPAATAGSRIDFSSLTDAERERLLQELQQWQRRPKGTPR